MAESQESPDERIGRILEALADPTRRRVVTLLARHDASVGDLARPFDVSVQAVSKHIRILEDAGIVIRISPGKRSLRRLDPQALAVAGEWLAGYRDMVDSRFRRLDTLLAEDDPSPGIDHTDPASHHQRRHEITRTQNAASGPDETPSRHPTGTALGPTFRHTSIPEGEQS